MICKFCGSENCIKNGRTITNGRLIQKHKCKDCHRESSETVNGLFSEVKKDEAKVGISEDELRRRHDAVYKIRLSALQLKEGVFLSEFEFMKMCNIPSGMAYRHIIDNGEFERYRGKAQKIIYWSHPVSIQKLKDEGVLT